jgi:hypothetical protein
MITDAQLACLKLRFPGLGEPTLRRNAEALLSRPHLAVLPSSITHPAQKPATARKQGKARLPRASKVPRTRNGSTWTEAQFWQAVRSTLRRGFRWWKPAVAALHAARAPFRGPRGQKWAFLCADCQKLFIRRKVQIDHVVACGALTDYAHVGEFVRRLTPESPDAFRVRCLTCHQLKTNSEKT